MLVNYILNITRKDFNSKSLHITGSLSHHLIRKFVAVSIDCFEIKRTYYFTHISLQRILQVFSNRFLSFIKEVFDSKLNSVRVRFHPNLCNRIYFYIDKILSRYKSVGLNINRNLSKIDFISSLQKWNSQASTTSKDSGNFPQSRNNFSNIRRSFCISNKKQN